MGAESLSSRAIIGTFYTRERLGGAPWVNQIGMKFTSDQAGETYNWLGQSPAMREWIGGRHAKGFRENGITILNKQFEATLEVAVQDLRRAKSDQILVRVRQMADRANAHWASLLTKLIQNGESQLSYDGQYFFDTDHQEGKSGVQSNNLSVDISALPVAHHGSPTDPSVEEMALAILLGEQQITGFVDDQAEPLNELAKNFIMMVPNGLKSVARKAIGAQTFGGGATNIIPQQEDFTIHVVSNPRLTWTNKFAIFRADGDVKPFILQEETALMMKAIAEGSELEFQHNKHHYGVDANRNVGYGYWQHACLVTLI